MEKIKVTLPPWAWQAISTAIKTVIRSAKEEDGLSSSILKLIDDDLDQQTGKSGEVEYTLLVWHMLVEAIKLWNISSEREAINTRRALLKDLQEQIKVVAR